MTDYDVIIIGAGPAGLFTALRAAKPALRILVLEKQTHPGRKLLLSGSGQCNFTNHASLTEFMTAYGEHGRFLKPALYHFSNHAIVQFFNNHGIQSELVEKTGKVFPSSRRATDILNFLVSRCQHLGINFIFNAAVTATTLSPAGTFLVSTASTQFSSHQLVIATGGQSYPQTGSTGDGYAFAQQLGHSIVPPKPGLTPFMIQPHPLAALSGTSFQNLIGTLWRNGKKLKTHQGDMVITHQGVSGPLIHNLSRYAIAQDTLCLSFLGTKNSETYKPTWLTQLRNQGRTTIKKWFMPQTPTQALGQKILNLASIDPNTLAAQLTRQQQNDLYRFLSAFPMKISGLGDFSVAMVTCGGVCLDDVSPKTMESRIRKNLYFVGEVLDIDGDSGGYDLQAAWSTGALAASRLQK